MTPMSTRIRQAGGNAVPMLVDIHIKAGAEACQALYALRHKGPRRPDVAEAERRLSNVLSLLFNGEK